MDTFPPFTLHPSPLILHLETGTAVCSVALSQGEQLLSLRENKDRKSHAQLLAVFIDDILREQQLTVAGLDAVAVSEGPGSYTGLRVGVSTAKGLCFGAQKPLIAVSSLQSLAALALKKQLLPAPDALIAPMIDARRMEVYTAVFNAQGEQTVPTEAKIIDENSFDAVLNQHPVLFIGDGANKCRETITHPNAHFSTLTASAEGMIQPALHKFHLQQLENVAYFEPFYLKDFVAIPSRKNLLNKG